MEILIHPFTASKPCLKSGEQAETDIPDKGAFVHSFYCVRWMLSGCSVRVCVKRFVYSIEIIRQFFSQGLADRLASLMS